MSEDLLKSRIEEIVHPIPAFDLRKNRFRRELYAHAHEHYERFIEQGHDAESAVSSALQKLGDPAQLRDDFLSAISRVEQWSYDYEHAAGSGRWRAIAPITIPIFFLSAILGFSPVFLLSVEKGLGHEDVWKTGWVVLVVYLCAMAIYSSFAWLGTPIRNTLRGEPAAWRNLAALIGVHVASFTVLSLLLLRGLHGAFVYFEYPEHDRLWSVYYAAPALMIFVEFTALFTLVYILVRERAEDERIPDWPYTEI